MVPARCGTGVIGQPSASPEGESSPWTGALRTLREMARRVPRRSSGEPRGWVSISRDLARWAMIAVPVGVVAGLGSAAFYALWLASTEFFLVGVVGLGYPTAGPPPGGVVVWSSSFPRILLLPLVMALGGFGAGTIAQRLAPEVAGHGTDQTIRSFHRESGRVRLRVPFLKIVATALTLGTGGSGGREGPAAQIGGGFGSWWASTLRLSDRERRVALASGLGAGVGAIFRAPLGGAIYSAEIFYTHDFEPDVFVPSIIASVVSYSVFGSLYGFSTLFAALPGIGWSISQIPLYALLGIVCAGVGIAFVRLFRRVETLFGHARGSLTVKTTLGALIAGLAIALVYLLLPWGNHFAALAAINVGYGFVQAAMLGQIGIATLAPLALVAIAVAIGLRMTTTAFTVGSGGSAGLFGTSVVLGAFIGTAIGGIFHGLVPGVVTIPDISAFAIVGMMTFFGGISKAPLAVLVMVVEMAGSYSLLLPAMLSIFIAYVATGPTRLYAEQVPTRLESPAHRGEYALDLLGTGPGGSPDGPAPDSRS
jgi:CIC family chloride channel protein